jgi:hypothetical protein
MRYVYLLAHHNVDGCEVVAVFATADEAMRFAESEYEVTLWGTWTPSEDEPHIPSLCCSKTEGKSWVVERWQMWTP